MTRDELQKLGEECHTLIQSNQRARAIKLWRAKTGQGLASAKRNIEAIEAGDPIEFVAEVCPELLKLYQEKVQKQLATMKGLTVLESLKHVPTLKQFVTDELDRWYIMYQKAQEASVFESTITKLLDFEGDDAPRIGTNTSAHSGDGCLEECACNYAEVIKRINLHIQMLNQMKKEDFVNLAEGFR